MTKIADSFCGYLDISNDTFAYNVSGHLVTLLPAQSELTKIQSTVSRIQNRNTDSPEYLFGVDNNYKTAILRKGGFTTSFWGMNSAIKFSTPIIIKSSGNTDYFYSMLAADWDKFHAITFCGGSINILYNPRMAVEQVAYDSLNIDGAREIRIRPWNDYTHSVDFEIDGEKVTLTVSVSPDRTDHNEERTGAFSLGKLNSFIRFSFEKVQCFDKIEKYYGIAKALISILTMQNNVFFEVYLSQKNSNNQLFESCICKIFDHYENYSARSPYDVIAIKCIWEYIPDLIDRIVKKKVKPLLDLLPEDNRSLGNISIKNIQDLCTALEVAYSWSRRRKEKDNLIEELKDRIQETIADFVESHNEIDVMKQTTIASAFHYLDYTLKQKILTMYQENSDTINAIISKHSLPQMDETNVGSFIKLRNYQTHRGLIEWDDSVRLYTPLFSLIYACLLREIKLPEEMIKSILLRLF